MRLIKFRGKKKTTNEWVYGSLVLSYDDECGVLEAYIMPLNFEDLTANGLVFFDEEQDIADIVMPETVGQYTGVKDKYGKEIYEGDICLVWYPSGYKKGVIEYQNGCFYWNDNSVSFYRNELIVVGNIYDNPENGCKSKQKEMNLLDAIKTGKPFTRKSLPVPVWIKLNSDGEFYAIKDGNLLRLEKEDYLAEDWIVKED